VGLEAGTTIADKYRLDRKIGSGGMGEVWAGESLVLGTEVAVKIMLPAASLTREVYARFKREAKVLARVRSDYVARVLDVVHDKKVGLVLVMDLIAGEPLSTRIGGQGRLSVEEMLDVCVDVGRGLRDLHAASVVHRDLKPGNVVLRPRVGQRPRAMLIDFGVSRIVSAPGEEEVTAITRADRVLGTLEYMAPEQILGSRRVTGLADVYALGAMAYRAVAGRHLFGDLVEGQLAAAKLNLDAPPLETGRSDPLARRFECAVARMLARRMRDRYESAEAMLRELESMRDAARRGEAAPQVFERTAGLRAEEPPTLDRRPDSSPRASTGASPVGVVVATPSSQPQTPMAASVQLARASGSGRRRAAPVLAVSLLVGLGVAGGAAAGASWAGGGAVRALAARLLGEQAAATYASGAPEAAVVASTRLPAQEPIAGASASASAAPIEIDLDADAGSAAPGTGPATKRPVAPARPVVRAAPSSGEAHAGGPAPRASAPPRARPEPSSLLPEEP
jgi:serine/threonine-protein kinase